MCIRDRGEYVRVFLPSALAEAEAGSIGDYIRTLFFYALAEAIATATGAGVSTYGSVTPVSYTHLKSELKLVESQYAGQANSYAALSAKA